LLFDTLKIENVAASHDSFKVPETQSGFIRSHNSRSSAVNPQGGLVLQVDMRADTTPVCETPTNGAKAVVETVSRIL